MNLQRQRVALAAITLIAQAGACAVQATPSHSYPVAGLAPYQRPVNAPTVRVNPVLDAKQALHGVSSPFPASLKFLDDQGAWFNPFTRPGMTGPYDLRGWHAAPATLPAADKK
jgi:hypothetical protein